MAIVPNVLIGGNSTKFAQPLDHSPEDEVDDVGGDPALGLPPPALGHHVGGPRAGGLAPSGETQKEVTTPILFRQRAQVRKRGQFWMIFHAEENLEILMYSCTYLLFYSYIDLHSELVKSF